MSSKSIHIWREDVRSIDGSITLSTVIEQPGKDRQILWFCLPERYRDALTESSDPFVIATIFLAMHHDQDLHMHGQVSPSLLSNLEEFQVAWTSWRPDTYRPVQISADSEVEAGTVKSGSPALSTFSGGVDSCYTAFRHANGTCGRWQRDLQASLMIHGFDIPLEKKSVFEEAYRRSQKITDSLGVTLIPVATNFRHIVQQPWTDVFGAGLASCLHLMTKTYSTGLVPSSYTYRTSTFPYGSNAITDPLLSSRAFSILYDGAGNNRFEKIRRMLEWPEMTENLRVCWQGEQQDRNCCRCEKCIRNILIFRALGVGLPACFPEDVSDQQIRDLRASGGSLDALESVGRSVKLENRQDHWVKLLNKTIRKNRRRSRLDGRVPPIEKKITRTIAAIGKRLLRPGKRATTDP